MKTQNDTQPYYFTYKNKGLLGVLNLLNKEASNNLLLRLLLKLDLKYFVILRFFRHIAEIEKDIDKNGADVQMTKLYEKLGLRLEIFNSFENGNMDRRKGLLIYGVNHPAVIEGFLLLTILRQKKIKMLGNIMYYYLGKNLSRFLSPVVPRKSTPSASNLILKNFSPLILFNKAEIMDDKQRRELNLNTLRDSAKVLEKGGVVVIFPAGAGDERTKWRGGLSKIIMNVSEDKRDDIIIVPVYFSGLGSKRMLLRIFKAYRGFKLKILRVGIYFGRERRLSEIYEMFGNKVKENKILDYLKRDAFSQFGLKEFPIRNYLYPKYYPKAVSSGYNLASRFLIRIITIVGLIEK